MTGLKSCPYCGAALNGPVQIALKDLAKVPEVQTLIFTLVLAVSGMSIAPHAAQAAIAPFLVGKCDSK